MVFSSILFLLYFLPILLVLYYLAAKKYKNAILLLSSLFFYSWGAPKFIFVILGTTIVDFFLVNRMHNASNNGLRKLLLLASLTINIGLLFYFKYANFFVDNVNIALDLFSTKNITWTKLILPIGISFYTFETITYVVDVYRKVHKPLNNFWDYQLYIILFPKLIAGPIIRYHDLANQINNRTQTDTVDNRLIGFYRFCMGLAKKVLIANHMALIADSVFAQNYADLAGYNAWIGILAYTFQIYFDFSGYSDMAIGLAKMFGFTFPENFNNPYTSQSITEFWRRWHISLGNWMRNYLYIPLGGNRVSNTRMYINLWLVFLASGLWHGASWSFIFWGAYHGLFLVLERLFLSKIYKSIGKLPSTIITFIIVMIGWVFFRVSNITDAFIFIKKIFTFRFTNDQLFDTEFYTYLAIAFLFAFFTFFKKGEDLQNKIYFNSYSVKKHFIIAFICIVLLLICIASITSADFNPFIYFRF